MAKMFPTEIAILANVRVLAEETAEQFDLYLLLAFTAINLKAFVVFDEVKL